MPGERVVFQQAVLEGPRSRVQDQEPWSVTGTRYEESLKIGHRPKCKTQDYKNFRQKSEENIFASLG